MARFILLTPIYGAPSSSYQPKKWPSGTTIADSAINQQPGDILWAALTTAPSSVNLAPLDALAQALLPGSTIITAAQMAAGTTIRNAWGVGCDSGD
jgi:hypothetical protein